MSGNENETDAFELAEDADDEVSIGSDALFGCYSVLSPGVEIVIEGRAVSAPAAD